VACDSWRKKVEAYVDGELTPPEARELGNHLRECHDCNGRLFELSQLKQAVANAGKAHSPSAEFRAKIAKSIPAKPQLRRNWLGRLVVAPAILVLILSLGVGIYVDRLRATRERVYGEVADLHVATLASASPVDVVSTDRHTVKPWFEGKIPFTFNLPELQGTDFVLVGGRVSYLEQSPGAQLIYRIRKHEISVFIFQDRGGPTVASSSTPVSQFSFNVENWTKNGLHYYVIGDVSGDDIEALSKLLQNAG
jgi:anti-sigma factor RsiW